MDTLVLGGTAFLGRHVVEAFLAGGHTVTCLARGTATIIRAALLGGPGDGAGRSGYWPWRFAHPVADAVAVPDAPAYPTALLDGRDLAAWTRLAAERRIDGTINAAGPTTELAVVLAAAREAAGSAAEPHPVPEPVRREHGIGTWMGPDSFPLWIDDPDLRGIPTLDTRAAREAGLVTRPLAETFRDTLPWLNAVGPPVGAGLSEATERAVLAAAAGG